MKDYVIRPFRGWRNMEALPIDTPLWGPVGDIAGRGRVGWTVEDLRVLLEAREKHIRAEEHGPLGNPWEDSCLEFFFSPVEGDGRYINLELNPNACLCMGLGDGARRLRILWANAFLRPKVTFTADGWQVEYRVPFDLIRMFFPDFDPRPGAVMTGNFYKCGDRTALPHYLSWNPVNSPTPNFHRPQDFGRLIFSD